ncbi:protein mono-ADP-ribosyltransferase PARP12-like [Panulirus ornatus]|uniref:protein mono-ADP-ribosyltransferase PARP12-like n=1 Tax=Panulirus ornatus TaxID=150431 RepID=UPI003A899A2F
MENRGGSWARTRGQGQGQGRGQSRGGSWGRTRGQGQSQGRGQGQSRGGNRGYSHHAQGQTRLGHFPSSGANKQDKRHKERGSVSMLNLGAMQTDEGTRANKKAPRDGREWENGHFHHQESHSHSGEGRWYFPSAPDKWQVEYDSGGATPPPPSYDESNERERARGFGVAPPIGPGPDVFLPRWIPHPSSSAPSSPPPPYMWGERAAPLGARDTGGHGPRGRRSNISAVDVVKCLSQFREAWGSAQVISRHLDCSADALKEIVASRPDIFSCMNHDAGMVIELVPTVTLCPDYLKKTGCTTRGQCKSLHLCSPFITQSNCELGPACPYGHRLDTDHNTSVLSKLYLDLIDKNVVFGLVRKVFKGEDVPRVCAWYNTTKGCGKEKCLELHICQDYARNGGQCKQGNCPLNHNILSDSCKKVLRRCGVSLNESIRDILLRLEMDGCPQTDESPSPVDSRDGKSRRRKKKEARDEAKVDPQVGGHRGGNNEGRKQDLEERERVTRRENDHAICQSTDVFGDVEIPEICVHSLDDRCLKEQKGCKYLHAKSTFHWQLHKDGRWYNLGVYHSKALENAFRDVAKNGVQLEALIPYKIGLQGKEFFKILGQDLWTADFTQMNLRSPSRSEVFGIRRLSTQSAAVSKTPRATVYAWYFLDEAGKWVAFGEVDSLGQRELACTITSEQIELEFVNQPSSGMTIKNSRYTYLLDFAQMTQTNTTTKRVRQIRRRPAMLYFAKKTGGGAWQSGTNHPPHWTPIPAGQDHLVVTLQASEAEYKEISTRLRATLPAAKIQKIQRLQNPYLWHHLQEKKRNFCKKYGERQLNMQKLFYGNVWDASCVEAISRENMDWRREMANPSRPYGQGTYFYNSAALASRNCPTGVSGHLTVVLADVIVGSIVTGQPNLSRPPVNEVTKDLYDTTVDNSSTPSTFVKYEKCEYYPEYFIQFI